jgi:hypothetical protein
MEDDDSDAEMADYGTDSADDVDPSFDAKARPQQGSTVEIRSRRSFQVAGASREVPFKLRLNLTLALALALSLVEECSSPPDATTARVKDSICACV